MPTPLISLRDDRALVEIAPAWGAALTRYDCMLEPTGGLHPVLRPWDGKTDGSKHPFSLACNVLLPWSNRIGASGFTFEGTFHPVAPNVAGEPYPLHGNGFQFAWSVERQDRHCVELRLRSKACKPFDYEALLSYTLDDGALTIALSVTHRGDDALPYGIGLHPWLLRAANSVISFDASHYWSESPDYLPVERIAIRPEDCMDFSVPKNLPEAWINTAFEGWGGSCTLASKATGLGIALTASASLSNLHIFSPSAEVCFVCIEPVSHVPNAHGISHLSKPAALTRLEQGQSLNGWLRFNPH